MLNHVAALRIWNLQTPCRWCSEFTMQQTGCSPKSDNPMVRTDGGWPSWKIQMVIITKQDQPLSVHLVNSKKLLILQFYWLVGHKEYERHWKKKKATTKTIESRTSQWQIAFFLAFACSPFSLGQIYHMFTEKPLQVHRQISSCKIVKTNAT